MFLFGPPDVYKMEAKRDVKGLIQALGYEKDPRIRAAAARALGGIGDARAVEPLIATLKDVYQDVRQAAGVALGKLGAPAVEPLIAALKGYDRNVQQAAAEALGETGDARAVEPLIAALDHYDVQQAAAEALGKIGDARAVEPLTATLKKVGKDVRRAAAVALGRLGAAAVEPLMAALNYSYDPDVRQAAAGALGRIGDARAVEPLIAALKGYGNVCWAAAEALDGVGWKPDASEAGAWYWLAKGELQKCAQLGTLAVEPLIAALKHGDRYVRQFAAEALVKLGAAAVEPLIAALKTAVKHCEGAVRQFAVEALGKIGTPAVEPLIAVLKDRDWDVRRAAAEALDGVGWEPDASEAGAWYWVAKHDLHMCAASGALAVEPLIAALELPHWGATARAAEALGEIGDARAVEPIIAAVKAARARYTDDADWPYHQDLHQAAVGALGKIGAPAVEPLIAALKDSDSDVRHTAAEALGKIGDRRAIPALTEAAARDGSPDVRDCAALSLRSIAAASGSVDVRSGGQ